MPKPGTNAHKVLVAIVEAWLESMPGQKMIKQFGLAESVKITLNLIEDGLLVVIQDGENLGIAPTEEAHRLFPSLTIN